MKTIYTFCRICTASCRLKVTVGEDNRVRRIEPDQQNPYTWRDFCPKGRTAAQSVEHPARLTSPMRRVGDRYVKATWAEAISDIAGRLTDIREQYGPEAIGMYIGNPAYYASANMMFASGLLDAIGTPNRYSATSLDTNNYHVVCEAMYGTPLMALVPDVDDCKCFLFVGMNPATSAMNWVFNIPNGWNRVLAAQANGADLIVVDPRRTKTAEKADTHLAVRPGQDWALLLGLLKVIFEQGLESHEACEQLNGVDAIRELAAQAKLSDLSERCGIAEADIIDVARRFALAETAMCDSHTGVAHHTTGTLGEWLSHLLNLVTGRIDRPGGRRKERGYVSTIDIWDKMAPTQSHVSRVRGLKPIAGYQPISELADEILTPGKGQIRAVILNAGNPVVSGPDGTKLDTAFEKLDLLVAVDLVQRESHRHADWLIPDAHWLEREDLFAFVSQMQDMPYVLRAVRPASGRPARRCPGSVAVLHRSRVGDEAPHVRQARNQRDDQVHPGFGPDDRATGTGVRSTVDLPDACAQRTAAEVERHQGTPARLGIREEGVRPFREVPQDTRRPSPRRSTGIPRRNAPPTQPATNRPRGLPLHAHW